MQQLGRGLSGSIERALDSLFSHAAPRSWYNQRAGSTADDAASAVDDFLRRAATEDITPVCFFDPGWFRANYRVEGPNAFLSYLSRPDQRFARPSPLFAPRWYARRYQRGRPDTHPFLDFLAGGAARNPHPLIDQDFLATQSDTWRSDLIAFEFLTDPTKFALKPHSLFDSPWYLERNVDVAEVGMNPLQHFLYYGHHEGRNPNRLVSIAWLRDNLVPGRKRGQIEPLSRYLTFAMGRHSPVPSPQFLASPAAKFHAHGPAQLVDALENNANLFAGRTLPDHILAGHFRAYLSAPLNDYNPDLPERILFLRQRHVAILYSARCASARIAYWWLRQSGLIETALRFSIWPHDFEAQFFESREHIADSLSFEPRKFALYKFVRHPTSRLLSAFSHYLRASDSYQLPVNRREMTLLRFLDLAAETQYGRGNVHLTPQITKAETAGRVRPRILKIEDGVDAHFQMLERKHELQPANLDSIVAVRQALQQHTASPRRRIQSRPDMTIPFGQVPDYRSLVNDEVKQKIYALYGADFDAYGYSPDGPR